MYISMAFQTYRDFIFYLHYLTLAHVIFGVTELVYNDQLLLRLCTDIDISFTFVKYIFTIKLFKFLLNFFSLREYHREVFPFSCWPLQTQKAPVTEQPYADKPSFEDRRAIEQKLRLTIILCSTCSEAAQISRLSLSFL